MKVVLFAGGMGLRIRDYSEQVPKPMVPISNRPILWHLMKWYSHQGHNEFIACLGHQGDVIKRYFLNYDESLTNDVILRKGGKDIEYLNRDLDDWTIHLVDTGVNASIGERLRTVRHLIDEDSVFLANYSDGVTDLDLTAYLDWFEERDAVAAFLAVRSPQSYHVADADPDGVVRAMRPIADAEQRINAGYFILRQEIFDYMEPGDDLVDAFARLIPTGRLLAYRYDGWWAPMDTFKEKVMLDDLAATGRGPWEIWKPTLSETG